MASEDSAHLEQSFLLIVRTRRIVTAVGSSAGFSEFPAYSRVLQLPRSIVTAAVYRGFISGLAPLHLTFRHRAGVTPYTSTSNVFAECCVFDKQSQPPILCGRFQLEGASPPYRNAAHLLPKLRCQFAEFLLLSSLKRLRIFILPTCVGLRYGHRSSR